MMSKAFWANWLMESCRSQVKDFRKQVADGRIANLLIKKIK